MSDGTDHPGDAPVEGPWPTDPRGDQAAGGGIGADPIDDGLVARLTDAAAVVDGSGVTRSAVDIRLVRRHRARRRRTSLAAVAVVALAIGAVAGLSGRTDDHTDVATGGGTTTSSHPATTSTVPCPSRPPGAGVSYGVPTVHLTGLPGNTAYNEAWGAALRDAGKLTKEQELLVMAGRPVPVTLDQITYITSTSSDGVPPTTIPAACRQAPTQTSGATTPTTPSYAPSTTIGFGTTTS